MKAPSRVTCVFPKLLFRSFLFISVIFSTTSFLWAESSGTGGGPLSGAIHVRVVGADPDEGVGDARPITGAFVMVGSRSGVPFSGNVGYTDAEGEITFMDPRLYGPQTVTAGAEGYRLFSLVGADAAEIVISLQPKDSPAPTSSVEGELTNFPGLDCDDRIQAAGVIPVFSLDQLMNFDVGTLVSESTAVEILGRECYLPGNIVIPCQKELPEKPLLCLVMGIPIEKERYRLTLPTGTVQDVFAYGVDADLDFLITGDFDLSQLTPSKIGIARDVSVAGDMTVDIDMSATLDPNLAVTVVTDNTPAGSDVYLFSLGEINGDTGVAPGAGDLILIDFEQTAGGSPVTAPLDNIANEPPFDDLRYLAMALAVSPENSPEPGITGQVDRSGYLPPATVEIASFFRPVRLGPVDGTFFGFSNAIQPGISPYPDVNLAVISEVTTVPDFGPGRRTGRYR